MQNDNGILHINEPIAKGIAIGSSSELPFSPHLLPANYFCSTHISLEVSYPLRFASSNTAFSVALGKLGVRDKMSGMHKLLEKYFVR